MKTNNPDVIVGAGLAGLIAAHAWPRTALVEAAPAPRETHRALLRFRDDSVSNLTGIEFKRVSVRKGIYYGGAFHAPDIRLANLYARKVLGDLRGGERSIWNIDPCTRYVAPPDFYDRLLDSVGPRISWGEKFEFDPAVRALNGEQGGKLRVLSTAPLPMVLMALGEQHDLRFESMRITVDRFEFPDVDLYQTIYFPDPNTDVYRASFTGSTLIVERVVNCGKGSEDVALDPDDVPKTVAQAFGLMQGAFNVAPASGVRVSQRYGKIAPVPDAARKALLFRLTHEFGIYSLGRFATWRNILLDDVVSDIAAVKRLLASDHTAYDMRKSM